MRNRRIDIKRGEIAPAPGICCRLCRRSDLHHGFEDRFRPVIDSTDGVFIYCFLPSVEVDDNQPARAG